MISKWKDKLRMSRNILIDGKDSNGDRVCVSVEDTLFNYFVNFSGGPKEARATIRNWILALEKPGSTKIRNLIYSKVIKPSLLEK